MTKTKEVKYRHCKDKNDGEGEIVCIDDLTIENRHSRKYYCLSCGKEMVAYLRGKKTKHFHHKVDCECNFETYLHILAKRLIKQRFSSSDSFPIVFRKKVQCVELANCLFYNEEECCEEREGKSDLRTWNGKIIYDVCEVEKPYGGFKPDLLLSCSSKPNRERVFIEVFKTHASTENKLSSGYRIIETMPIKSEAEIEDIIKRGFVEGENCKLYKFKKLPRLQVDNRPINRFILHLSEGATIKKIKCGNRSDIVEHNSIAELNIDGDKLKKYPSLFNWAPLPDIYVGLIYLHCKGFDIKNCLLCKYHCIKNYNNASLCKLYKKYGTPEYPRQTSAKQCQYYRVSEEIKNEINGLSYGLHEIVEEVKEFTK